jgi:hypothetical protein
MIRQFTLKSVDSVLYLAAQVTFLQKYRLEAHELNLSVFTIKDFNL